MLITENELKSGWTQFINVAVLTIGCRRFYHRLWPFWPKIFSVLTNACRRFDLWLSPFWLIVVAVLTYALSPFWPQLSPFWLSPFWRVAVCCRRSGLVAVMTCIRHTHPFSLHLSQLKWHPKLIKRVTPINSSHEASISLESTENLQNKNKYFFT